MRQFALTLLSVFALGTAACQAQDADPLADVPDGAKSLVVAGGCFWCVESDMEKVDGVYEAVSGYSGGDLENATYQNHDGHREVAEIWYDPAVTDYATLVHHFLRTIDVTDGGGQFCDRGFAYSTALHYRTDEEKADAEAAIAEAQAYLGQDIATVVEPFKFFVTAEGYHQDYYQKNPFRYKIYRTNCGRDSRVRAVWGEQAAGH